MKTLVITDSWDATSDVVINRLGEEAFRLNTDLIRDYVILWDAEGFSISSPSNRTIDLFEIGSVYWRKPFTSLAYDDSTHPERFFYSECRYLVRELYNVARLSGAFALVEEGAERRLGKIRQLLLAKKYFQIPEWKVLLGYDYTATVVKSLSGEQVDEHSVLYTTRIGGNALDPSHVWFTQREIKKTADVTACFVDGRVFAFELRPTNEAIDWRINLTTPEMQQWRPFALTPETVEHIIGFMKDCNLRYGRLDFVLQSSELFFLEVNPNGQWAWLDLNDSVGLISAMVDAIRGFGPYGKHPAPHLIA